MKSPVDMSEIHLHTRSHDYPLSDMTKEMYMMIGKMYYTEDKEEKSEQFIAVEQHFNNSMDKLQKLKSMIRYEETRLRQSFRGAKLVHQDHSRFHNPDWMRYYNNNYIQDGDLNCEESFCILCYDLNPGGALICNKCALSDNQL